jgi:FkbM family methyltransferase
MKHELPLLKRWVPSLKKRWASLISKNGFFIRRSQGAFFLLNPVNFVDRQIAFYDDYEIQQFSRFEDAMRSHGCDLFLDVGANLGYYSILVAKRGLARRVVAFEPDMRNRYQFEANIFMNRLTDKIEVIPKAVTSFTGKTRFQLWGASSTGQSKVSVTGDVDVETTCLDDFVEDRNARIFVKMDIEGHELEALRGMTRMASENKLFLQVEAFPENLPKVCEVLAGMGLQPCGSVRHDHYFSNF